MATVNSALDGSLASNSIDQVKRAVNISDAATMENNFISLMVAQIKNQDPTKPVDSTEFLNQYSAMSQVKSMENMSSLMQNNLVLTDNLQTLTAAGLVGQQVSVAVETLDLSGQAVNGQFDLSHASNRAALLLTDSNGTQTRIELGAQSPGKVPFVIDPAKHGLRDGRYSVSIESENGEFPQVEVAGQVSNVRVSAEGPVLQVQGVGSVPFYNILEFAQADAGLLGG
ncbi:MULTISPECIES: flagellar hook capping FlgD N-terminal domain-containing protein [Pseudomonadaceae]|uniref:flagellar hook capping FlgD N-terminal domain-containing protein n=1 Tax=Pseudomonadaceae TaxID=135621 RepID=UPI0015E3A576|nr:MULTISPECIES: flagellar hook capping FlgD N-terminal domain-containing protein [Pseudomonadaceae]MBA1276325.1 flagellar hook assembly protein FlgD [Stutzerimonas stutzeri]MBC8648833.1 flagellar hook assembly protein FlgD [Pseudomonas sp. MT4]QXY92804.1 flagellar hook assembly protein FlgD [Pseudomonas sp. MTM4]